MTAARVPTRIPDQHAQENGHLKIDADNTHGIGSQPEISGLAEGEYPGVAQE